MTGKVIYLEQVKKEHWVGSLFVHQENLSNGACIYFNSNPEDQGVDGFLQSMANVLNKKAFHIEDIKNQGNFMVHFKFEQLKALTSQHNALHFDIDEKTGKPNRFCSFNKQKLVDYNDRAVVERMEEIASLIWALQETGHIEKSSIDGVHIYKDEFAELKLA